MNALEAYIHRVRLYLKKDSSRLRKISTESGFILVGQIVSVLGAIVSVRVLTEHLRPTEYGKLALGLTIATLLSQVVMGVVSISAARFYSIALEKNDLRSFLGATRRLALAGTLIVVMLGAIFVIGLTVLGLNNWIPITLACLVFSIVSGHNNTLNSIQSAARQRAIVALHSGMDAWLKISLAIGVMFLFSAESTAVIWGYTLSASLIIPSQLYFLNHLIRRQQKNKEYTIDENWQRQMLTFAWPFSAWGIFAFAQLSSDRWALEHFASTSEVGQYAVLYQLGYTPIGVLTGLVVTLVGPILFQLSGDGQDKSRTATAHYLMWRVVRVTLLLTMLGVFSSWVFHEQLFLVLVSAAFRETSYLLPWVVLAGGLFAGGQLLALKQMSELKSRSLAFVKIATALLGTAMNVAGAWLYGLAGVIGSIVVFSIVYFSWMFLLSYRLPVDDV